MVKNLIPGYKCLKFPEELLDMTAKLWNMTDFSNYHSYAYPDEKHQKMLRDNGFPLMHEWELHEEFTRRKFAVAMSSPKWIATIEDVLSPLVIKTIEEKSHSFVNWMVEFLVHKLTK